MTYQWKHQEVDTLHILIVQKTNWYSHLDVTKNVSLFLVMIVSKYPYKKTSAYLSHPQKGETDKWMYYEKDLASAFGKLSLD